ncbi:hypothetical protein [uncultured Nocardioides sp.]|uniref:hypothetical protein n=1 Tax=uncultured Nocardioides sp. TaxID=198441 RepID=UPI002617D9D4|nr:hypothetical protein [uncultured Nocardioides sp.]
MSSTHAPSPAPTAERRVRHQARDAAALMAFSLATSVGAATGLALLTGLPGLGR